MIDHVAYGSGFHGIAPEAAPAVPSALDADIASIRAMYGSPWLGSVDLDRCCWQRLAAGLQMIFSGYDDSLSHKNEPYISHLMKYLLIDLPTIGYQNTQKQKVVEVPVLTY